MAEKLETVSELDVVGRRSGHQGLHPVEDERLEVGLSSFDDHGSEGTRRLEEATEYHYVLSGWTQYLDVDRRTVHDFVAGDLYAIAPGTSYARKWKPGTRTLFVRIPPAGIEHTPDEPVEVSRWREDRLRTERRDYWNSADAPPANSVRPAVAVAVMNPRGQLLLLRRSDSGNWTMPGGTLEHHDSLVDCAVREVHEESGLDVTVSDVIGTYTDPDVRVAYSDGEVRREFTVLLAAQPVEGDVTIDEESTAFGWHNPSDLDGLSIAPSQKRRISDVIEYLTSGKRSLR